MRVLLSRGSGTARRLLPTLQGDSTEVAGGFLRRWIRKREGVVVIMGATGTGKSKLSVDVSTRFPAEVVNADKIQVYRGLDITTNKMPLADRRGVPHRLLGELDPTAGELLPAGFRSLASAAVTGITARGRIPVIAGGSNSYIHAMMVDRYDEREHPFSGASAAKRRLRYRSCLLWVDVEPAALEEHLDRRVDEMVAAGMVEELERYFAAEGLDAAAERHPGLGKAIGVPELREYFRWGTKAAYDEAVAAIKTNTRRLAEEQVRKIKRLGEMGWPLQRLDGTATVEAKLDSVGKEAVASAAWEKDVLCPALSAVERFLEEDGAHQLQLMEAA